MGGSRRHLAVIWTIVESGAIYSAATTTLLVLFVLKMQAGAVVGDSLGQISVCFQLNSDILKKSKI